MMQYSKQGKTRPFFSAG